MDFQMSRSSGHSCMIAQYNQPSAPIDKKKHQIKASNPVLGYVVTG